MKFKRLQKDGPGRYVLVCSRRLLFWEKDVKFLATREYPPGYWSWLSLPNLKLVGGCLSFQLDAWCREALLEE